MKKRLIALLLGLSLLLTPTSVFATVGVKIDGLPISFNNNSGSPFIDDLGRTQVPLRETMEQYGCKVKWDQQNQNAIVEKNNISIKIPMYKNYISVNGKTVPIDTSAMLKDNRVYLPIRPVVEAFGSTVSWEKASSTVKLSVDNKSSEIIVPSEYLETAVPVIASKVSFENDIRVFTVFAFMNYTGYDDNNGHEITGVRKEIRDELNAKNIKISDPTYYKTKNVSYSYYNGAINFMSGAPDFKYVKETPEIIKSLNDLPDKLSEFYKAANIEELYEKYNPAYQKELSSYSRESYLAIAKINYFLKIDNSKINKFGFCLNLLDAYERGYGLGADDYYKGYNSIIIGPSNKINTNIVVHEYLHGITNPLVKRNSNEVNKLSYLKNKGTSPAGYENSEWNELFEESLVRSIEAKAVNGENASEHCLFEDNRGFVLTSYFHAKFLDYPKYEGTLDSFLIKTINEYK